VRPSRTKQPGSPAGRPRPGPHRNPCRPAGPRPHRQCKKPNTLSTLLQCLAISVEADHFAQPQPTKFSLRRAVRAGCLFRLPPFRPASLPSWASARARAIRPTARLNLNVASLWVRGRGRLSYPFSLACILRGGRGKLMRPTDAIVSEARAHLSETLFKQSKLPEYGSRWQTQVEAMGRDIPSLTNSDACLRYAQYNITFDGRPT